jgi:putative ABC transport system permease protein
MTDLFHRLRSLFLRNTVEAEMDQELRFHVERETEKYLKMGMSCEQAVRQARLALGGVDQVKEECREARGVLLVESLWQDLRYAVRMLRKAPGFTLTTVLILALGIGINSAIFSVVYHVLLEPLPFPHSERLYSVWTRSDATGANHVAASGPDFLDYHDQSRSFSFLSMALPGFTFTWTGEGDPKLVNCTGASEEFFAALGIRPYLGRLYEPREYTYLKDDTIVISYRFWKNQLGGDPHVLGRTIHFQDEDIAIVGVLPDMPDLFPETDVWPKLTVHPSWPFMQWRGNKFLNVIGQLKPGVTPKMAAEDLTAILRRAPGEPPDVRVQMVPLKDDLVGSVHAQLQVIMAAVSLVLLIACINVAALLLARSGKRSSEMALRASLGAVPRRLTQQLMVEGVVLTTVATSFGVFVGWLGLRCIRYWPRLQLPRMEGIHLNAAALLATAAVAIAITLVFGWAPSFMLSRMNLSATLRSGRRETGPNRRSFSLLVIAEIACAVVLTVCAGLLLRSFWRVQQVNPGFQPDYMLKVYLRTNFYGPEGRSFWKGVLDGVSTLPDVRLAALADCTPGSRAAIATLVFDDRANDPNHAPPAQGCWMSPDFFRTSGTPLMRGRSFSEHDDADSPAVVIINAEAARLYWPGENPVGRRIGVNYTGPGRRSGAAPRMREIVGVVGSIKHGPLDGPTTPAVYMPYLQDETNHDMASMSLFIRSAGNSQALVDSVRGRIHAVSPSQPVQDVWTMRDIMERSLAPRRYSLFLLAAFATLAVLLAAIGIYGVVSYTTSLRTREFGVRIALGATGSSLILHVVRQGLVLTATGALVGAGVAVLVTRALSQLLFQVSPLDVITFTAAVLLLALISVGACLLPAWRASRTDPMVALRCE